MATLDVLDVLLQSQERDGTVPDMPNSVLELSTGMLFLYTCADSFAVMKVRRKRVIYFVARCYARVALPRRPSPCGVRTSHRVPKKRLGAVTAAVAQNRGTRVRRRRHPRPLNARVRARQRRYRSLQESRVRIARKRCPWES